MIQNEKQHKISVKKLNHFTTLANEVKPFIDNSLEKKLQYASYCQIKNKLAADVKAYSKTKQNGVTLKRQISITQLPDVLIKYKISKKLSQKDFSAILGIKEQQLQRYEADKYASVSFKRLLSFVEKTDLEIMLSVKNT